MELLLELLIEIRSELCFLNLTNMYGIQRAATEIMNDPELKIYKEKFKKLMESNNGD